MKKNEKHYPKILDTYLQHGVNLYLDDIDSYTTDVKGDCFLCGKEKHLGICIDEAKPKQYNKWHCLRCGQGGGIRDFLMKIHLMCQEDFQGDVKYKISKKRRIKLSTFELFDFGYNGLTQNYTMSIFDLNREKIHDVRRYEYSSFKSSSGQKTAIINWDKILKCKGTIYLCAGEWDTMTMGEVLSLMKQKDDIAIGAMGEGIFKTEWCMLFKDKKVAVLYDCDKAGTAGMIKVYNNIKEYTKSLKFIHWDRDKFKKGFDISDLYLKMKKSPAKTLQFIKKYTKLNPPTVDIEDVVVPNHTTKIEKFNGGGLSAEQVYNGYKEFLHLPDTSVLDVMFGTIIGNRIGGDPLWTFIVAPSGFTKSVFLKSISESKGIHTEDSLSVAALVSGFTAGGVDFSLLPQLDGKVLVIKDFTTVLKQNPMAREEIFGMLRSIYDGSFSKRFGNTERRYNSRFGIVAGVTPAIEIFLTGESALGERFLRYELRLPSSVNEHLRYIERAMDNIEREVEIEGALRDLANTCLDYSFSFSVTIPKEIKAKIMYLALYTSIMRSTLERDKYTKEILFRPFQEAGTRLAKQFMKLLIGICKFRRARTATDSEYRILCNLAAGTVPSREGDIVKYIYKNFRNKSVQLKQVAEKVNLQRTGCSIITTGLCALKVLKKMKETNLFRLTDQIIEIVDRSEIFNRSTSVKKIKKSKKTKIIVRN